MRILHDGTMPATQSGPPPFTPVSRRLLEMLSREDTVVEQVADLMHLDASFVADTVRATTPPVFGFQRNIRSLARVVALFGVDRLQSLAASIDLKQSSGRRELEGYWRHSVASGFMAAELASADDPYDAALPDHAGSPGVSAAPAAPPAAVAGNAESPADVVGLACRTFGAPGFSGSLEELLSTIPEAGCCNFGSDPARIARLFEHRMHNIDN